MRRQTAGGWFNATPALIAGVANRQNRTNTWRMAIADQLSILAPLRRGPAERYALGSAAFFAAVVLLLALAVSLDRARRGEDMELFSIVRAYALGFLPWLFLAPFIFARARRGALQRRSPRLAALDVLGLAAITLLVVLLHIFLLNAPLQGLSGFDLLDRVRLLDWMFDVFIFALCFAGGRLDGERELKETAAKERHALEKRLLRLEQEATSLELNDLRNRFSSHFVLNALSNILGLVRTAEPQAAAEAILALGDILKRVSGSGGAASTVGAEVEFLRAYLKFQRIRYPTAEFVIEASEHVMGAVVPTFLLQPLVENSFKHGLTTNGTLRAELSMRRQDRRLSIRLANSLNRSVDAAGVEGEGRRLTRARLELAYGGDFTMREFVEADRYIVEITVPDTIE